MIETIKDLLDIDTDLKDNILNHYLDKSQLAIKQYCNIDEIPETLNPAVVDLSYFLLPNRDKVGVRQATQGSRSQTLC